jgi:hypothetical protein
MRSFKILSIAGPIMGLAITLTTFAGSINKKKADADKGFAVVELFTSEGCSSCPPADAVVAKIEKESAGQPIYILAFHVDYWNSASWKDVFSDADYSRRQNQYARWLKLSSVYTPQIVVNGKKEFVGSEEGTLRNVLKTDLQTETGAQLNLSNVKVEGKSVSIQYQAQGGTGRNVLLLALVQKYAQHHIGGGENNGRILSHVQIVRALKSVSIGAGSGSATLSVPPGFDPKQYELIGFVQNTANGNIICAAKATF